MLTPVFTLDVLPAKLAICQLKPRAAFPRWIERASTFLSISRTPTELSIVADEAVVPESVRAERGYRALRVKGPLQLDMVGVMASLSTPLAIAGVPVSVIATFDTDYLLIHRKHLVHACWALETAGHTVIDESQAPKAASF